MSAVNLSIFDEFELALRELERFDGLAVFFAVMAVGMAVEVAVEGEALAVEEVESVSLGIVMESLFFRLARRLLDWFVLIVVGL